MKVYDIHIFVCTNQRSGTDRPSCGEAHGLALTVEFKKQLKNTAAHLNVRTSRSGCLGICDYGPTVVIYPEGTFYVGVKVEDVAEIVTSHIVGHKPVERLLLPENWRRDR